jgi:hypothetical protein
MDIDELEAGRTLDALIALEVMGLGIAKAGTIESLGFPQARGEKPSVFPPKCVTMGIKEDDNVLEDGSPIPPYSTEIAAAWGVFEKVFQGSSERGFAVARENTWIIYEISGHDLDYVMDGDTAPLAICRAALEWLQRST